MFRSKFLRSPHRTRLCATGYTEGLPFEVLDLILGKVVLLQMYFGDKAKRPADRCIFMNLASVNRIWSEIIKRRHFKMAVVHILAVYFRKSKKRSIIIDHNFEFLKEVLQPDSLIDQLDLTGCLHQNQIKKLKRIRKVKDKNDELLFLLRNFNSQNYSQFVQGLCATDQKNAARLLEHGGETVKVHIANRDTFQTAKLEISLATKLLEGPEEYDQYWRYNGVPDEQCLDGVSVLHANQNHGITIWLWFKTEDAWNKMKANSKYVLLEIVRKLFQHRMPESTIETQNVQLQYINLKYEFAKRKLIVQSKRGFQTRVDAEHLAVLKDKIYVTQKRSILVYENKAPYRQLPEIRLPEAFPDKRTPLQIAVCQMHNRLYAADKDNECIYKIEPMYDHRITSWLNEAESLFVATTRSGEVLVVRTEIGANSLRVFNSYGVRMHHTVGLMDCALDNKVISVQEIAPNVIVLIYSNQIGRTSFCLSAIFTMRLNRLELIDRNLTFGIVINCLVPVSSCQLLIGVGHDYDDYDEEKCYRLGLYDCQFQNILREKTIPIYIYFSADKKELFVLTAQDSKYLSEARKQLIAISQLFDGMLKQSKRFPNTGEYEWFCDSPKRLTKMKRRLTDMGKNFKIEIYKFNYEDDDYD